MIPPSVRTLLRTTPTIAHVPNRSLLFVSGSQAAEFLNGVVACSAPTSSKHHFYSAFLHAQGRVLYDAFFYSHSTPEGKQGYIVEYDSRPSEAPSLIPMLKKYVLRAKVRIRDVSNEYDVWAAWGSGQESQWETTRLWNASRSGVVEPVWEANADWPWGSEPTRIQDRRAIGMGHRLLVRKGDRPQEAATHDTVPEDVYTTHRILHGVPEGIQDIVPMQAFPMESNMDIMGGLDFRKGCFVGQELTVRTYHTGILRKRIFPVHIHPQDGATNLSRVPSTLDVKAVATQTSPDGRPTVRPRGVSKLLSTSGNVGLALMRMDHIRLAESGGGTLLGETKQGENESSPSTTWSLEHWRPDWWPDSVGESE